MHLLDNMVEMFANYGTVRGLVVFWPGPHISDTIALEALCSSLSDFHSLSMFEPPMPHNLADE